MHFLSAMFLLLASVITPARTWYPPDQPLNVTIKPQGEAQLVLTDFTGKTLEGNKDAANVGPGEATKDLKTVFPQVAQPGTYILYVVPKGKEPAQFEGTPLVIRVHEDKRHGAAPGPEIIKVEPLKYAVMTTKQGTMTMGFYYDVAPNTVNNFLTLAEQGYFDGLTFHRIMPEFVIQGGDPRGDGTGGPGYQINAEFNERPHEPGVLSMARSQEENSAGSQFFICLNYKNTSQLDRKYTAFGRVVDGMDVVKAIAATPIEDPQSGRPKQPPVIEKVEVKPVTASENPYPALQKMIASEK